MLCSLLLMLKLRLWSMFYMWLFWISMWLFLWLVLLIMVSKIVMWVRWGLLVCISSMSLFLLLMVCIIGN